MKYEVKLKRTIEVTLLVDDEESRGPGCPMTEVLAIECAVEIADTEIFVSFDEIESHGARVVDSDWLVAAPVRPVRQLGDGTP
jgi:hypothetical protein